MPDIRQVGDCDWSLAITRYDKNAGVLGVLALVAARIHFHAKEGAEGSQSHRRIQKRGFAPTLSIIRGTCRMPLRKLKRQIP